MRPPPLTKRHAKGSSVTREEEFMERAPIVPDDEVVPGASETSGMVNLSALSLPQTGFAKAKRQKVITTLNLSSRTCKWPIGDPARPDFHYCGEPPRPGRVYCGTHDSMSYQPVTRRKPG
jgi:GcrA cell cycle regulator